MTKEQLIKVLYPTVPTRALCEYLGYNTSQLYNRVFSMGIKKNPRIKALQNRELRLASGIKYRFQPGQVAHNKGKQMSSELYNKVAPTMFKKGNKPHNTRGDHATSIRYDKTGKAYIYYKIADSQWVLYHRWIWEQANGPIPAKHIIRFIDGDTMNVELSNMECIPMRENAIRNSINRFPNELQTVIRLKSKLNKQIKNHGKKRNE